MPPSSTKAEKAYIRLLLNIDELRKKLVDLEQKKYDIERRQKGSVS